MNNIYLFVVFIAIILVGCKEDAGKKTIVENIPTNTDTFYLCDRLIKIDSIDKGEFEKLAEMKIDTSEANCIANDSFSVKRFGDTLNFLLENGNYAMLINNTSDNDSSSKYFFQGLNKELNQFVVYGIFYEWWYHVLIDKRTGDTTVTCGPPVVSPDKKFFVCTNSDIEAQYTFNGIELFENTSPPKLVCSRELNFFGLNKIKWSDNNTLYAEVDVIDSTQMFQTKKVYCKLSIH